MPDRRGIQAGMLDSKPETYPSLTLKLASGLQLADVCGGGRGGGGHLKHTGGMWGQPLFRLLPGSTHVCGSSRGNRSVCKFFFSNVCP